MQKSMYEKAMAQETRNGGTSTVNNSSTDHSKRRVLVALDIFCLLLGEFISFILLLFYFYSAFILLFSCFLLLLFDGLHCTQMLLLQCVF